MGQAGNWLLLIGVYVGLRLYGSAINFYRFTNLPEPEKPGSEIVPAPALSAQPPKNGNYCI
jgi:hypothetical protein